MSQINPLTGAVLQTHNVQRQQSAEKPRPFRQVLQVQRPVGNQDDELELQVENSDELHEIDQRENPQDRKQRPPKREKPPEKNEPPAGLDLTA